MIASCLSSSGLSLKYQWGAKAGSKEVSFSGKWAQGGCTRPWGMVSKRLGWRLGQTQGCELRSKKTGDEFWRLTDPKVSYHCASLTLPSASSGIPMVLHTWVALEHYVLSGILPSPCLFAWGLRTATHKACTLSYPMCLCSPFPCPGDLHFDLFPLA